MHTRTTSRAVSAAIASATTGAVSAFSCPESTSQAPRYTAALVARNATTARANGKATAGRSRSLVSNCRRTPA